MSEAKSSLLYVCHRNLEQLNRRKVRVAVSQKDGSVQVYTKEQLESLTSSDHEILKAVKKRIVIDRLKAAQQVCFFVILSSFEPKQFNLKEGQDLFFFF
ncbi:hypothetical protein PoB_001509600 [Plakobranchus ocellatus]|uniref:Uncharacterized protein n=1 Tax=Plakobranchus ocellatus TaxID=259542 RepID=A0AAV3YYF9_9GAST|nr:hypothetical protein PoB_001509600 [Plakobranchus ocellatus]